MVTQIKSPLIKAEAIRAYVAKNPNASHGQVSKAMATKGIAVSPAHVATVRRRARGWHKGSNGATPSRGQKATPLRPPASKTKKRPDSKRTLEKASEVPYNPVRDNLDDLARIVAAWPQLAEPVRHEMLDLIQRSRQSRKPVNPLLTRLSGDGGSLMKKRGAQANV